MAEKTDLTPSQELVYEMKASEVMTREVVTVAPEMLMSELCDILRSNRISGMPVTTNGQMAGIISIEDFIKWLTDGAVETRVEERMITEVTTVCEDDPLVLAVNLLDKHGYGRLPVIQRDGGELVGVITKGDIVAGLLRKLEIGFQEQEIRQWRASHIFEDIVADKTTLVLRYNIAGKDFKKAGIGATSLKRALSRLQIHPHVRRRAAIIAYEAEMNIVIYAQSGELVAKVESDQITIEANDNGPGIADIEQAFTPGYSTASDWVRELGFGAGMGLCNIKKCSDETNLESVVGEGTRLEAKIAI